MMTWKTRLLHFERMCDGLVEHFLLQHKILGFLLIFIGMPLVTLSAVCICSTVLVLPLALAFGTCEEGLNTILIRALKINAPLRRKSG